MTTLINQPNLRARLNASQTDRARRAWELIHELPCLPWRNPVPEGQLIGITQAGEAVFPESLDDVVEMSYAGQPLTVLVRSPGPVVIDRPWCVPAFSGCRITARVIKHDTRTQLGTLLFRYGNNYYLIRDAVLGLSQFAVGTKWVGRRAETMVNLAGQRVLSAAELKEVVTLLKTVLKEKQ